jgi:serine/threonine-protein kinase HipA
VNDVLDVWLYGMRVATIEQQRGRLRLAYTDEAQARYDAGTPLLSWQFPVVRQPYPNAAVRAFLDGLLPEGSARNTIAADLGISATDTFGLIGILGRECAGAVVILPAAEGPSPAVPTLAAAAPLTPVEQDDLGANLRSAPLGVSASVRLSLAGVQEKLVLTRLGAALWGRPIDGAPSTHILKPESRDLPDTVENEAFCMRLAKQLGLSVANVETTMVGGRKLLVVERYDRIVHEDGAVERIHQTDVCQALGIPPAKKYEEDGGPSLKRVADLLTSAAGGAAAERLLEAVTLNVLIANGDAHGKNFSVVYDASGRVTFAPLYDLMSTLIYSQDRLAMYIDTVQRTRPVTADRLVAEAASWGMPRRRATQVIHDLIDRAPGAIASAERETAGTPESLLTIVREQLGVLAETLPDA